MRISNFFIDRPVFSIVLSAIIFIAGVLALFTLPVNEYPNITPPVVEVTAGYPGAPAAMIEKTIAIPIEENVNGAKNLVSMASRSANDGTYSLECTFRPGSDPDIDSVEVQNRVLQAQDSLPRYVIDNGIIVGKRTPTTLMIISLYSPHKTYDSLFLSNYAQIHIIDPVTRTPGVGDYDQHGHDFAMRLWVDPSRMASLNITASDIKNAVETQNLQTPTGQIGGPPSAPNTNLQFNVLANNEITQPDAYENMIVRHASDGSVLRLRDFGHVALGARNYSTFTSLNGLPVTSIMLYQLPNANALQVERAVKKTMDRLAKNFPADVKYAITMDSTNFIVESIHEVLWTLVISLLLVFLVIFLFLGNLRATLIPVLAVPVSLVGTLGVYAVLGFSINLLTLFGMVLAIGMVVDDAIVVVEATERHLREGVSGREAARRAMADVSRAVMAIALVLTFVFVPIAFIPGVSGSLYRQFALTLASAVLLSALVALTLTPALCGLLLRESHPNPKNPIHWVTNKFNAGFDRAERAYSRVLETTIRHWRIAAVGMTVVCGAVVLLLHILPTGFVPQEDQGYFYMALTMPEGTSLQRTHKVASKAEAILDKLPGVQYVNTLGGYTYLEDSNQPNAATLVVDLKPWSERTGSGLSATALMTRAQTALAGLADAQVTPLPPAAVPGLGGSGGFTFELQDLSGHSIEYLANVARNVSLKARRRPSLADVFDSVKTQVPQVTINIDRDKANTLGVPVSEIVDSLQMFLGGITVNNFTRFGRIYKTIVQAAPEYRSDPDDIDDIYVRSKPDDGDTSGGAMIPLSNLATLTPSLGPNVVQRFNLYRSAEISGENAAGYSSGQALAAMEKIAKGLPKGMGYQWSGIAYQQEKAGGTSGLVFALSLLFVFLILAAQFESWFVPIAIVLAVPTGALGAFLAVWMRGIDNNIYVQVGVVTLIGLTAKNAVLIVEFATTQIRAGKAPFAATLEAARLRLRPILMTSLAFIFAMLPLTFATGAGSNSRHALGTAVLGGMISTTLLAIFFVPVFFLAIVETRRRRSRDPERQVPPVEEQQA
jgi:multidrug efflux pump